MASSSLVSLFGASWWAAQHLQSLVPVQEMPLPSRIFYVLVALIITLTVVWVAAQLLGMVGIVIPRP